MENLSQNKIIVLYHNQDFLAVEKPAGISCHNDQNSILRRLDGKWHLVHRLDRETSGVLLLTQKPEKQEELQKSLKEGRKKYVAILRGQLPTTTEIQTWSWPLTNQAEGRMNPQGKENERVTAVTHWRCLAVNEYFSLAELFLETGRQHQIRRHALLAGRPVVGDSRYGSEKDNQRIEKIYKFDRLALHASELSFLWQGENIVIESKTPEDFYKLIK